MPEPTTPFEAFVINSLTTLTTNVNDIIDTQTFLVSQTVTHVELKETLVEMKNELQTKFKSDIAHAKTEIMDHTSRECRRTATDDYTRAKQVDARTTKLSEKLREKKVLTHTDHNTLLTHSPFAKLAGI